MSDRREDLFEKYERNVLVNNNEQPRSIGLFPIPEYPELEVGRGMWSSAFDAILTTLRYLAPATLLTLFFGHQSFLFKLLKSIDSAFRAIVFSSEEQKKSVLKWIAEAGPVKVEHLETVWRHGWILCGVLDASLPGACAGHPPTRLSLKHAQTIADHYLGVEPVFSRQELDSNDSLSKHQEWKLATYLDRIRQALSKLTPPVSKPASQRTSPETAQFTLDYVAKGSGLLAAQTNNKMYFKIYPTAQQSIDPGEITILIRGPKDTYGMTVLPPILGKAQLIRQRILGLQSKASYTENVLPITQGATYLRTFGKNDMKKTYYIPKTNYDIDIDAEKRPDHVKIGYVVNLEGKYVISITSRGQCIIGSPFSVIASNNIIGILEKDNFCLEDGEEIGIVDVKTDRKVVLRIVDFVTEKMLLRENGSLERISDDEAKILMSTERMTELSQSDSCSVSSSTENENQSLHVSSTTTEHKPHKFEKFYTLVREVIIMNRICKIFYNLIAHGKPIKVENNKSRNQKDIPDIVNSTFLDSNASCSILPDNKDKYLVPESISITLRTEKAKIIEKDEIISAENVHSRTRYLDQGKVKKHNKQDITLHNLQGAIPDTTTSRNPFVSDIIKSADSLNTETFVNTDYERNNSQSEEIQSAPIIVNAEYTASNNNPFTEPDIILERPKTPLFKIISGNVINREDSVYINSKVEKAVEETFTNEFVNPFFMHQHHQSSENEGRYITDFIIGAPVSLPPIVRGPSPDPSMESILFTSNNNKFKENQIWMGMKNNNGNISNYCKQTENEISCAISTEMEKTSIKETESCDESTNLSNFHSMDSNLNETTEILDSTTPKNKPDSYTRSIQSSQNITTRRDTWDSAYVSIDDNNSSPDNNNNENSSQSETDTKKPTSFNICGLKSEELSKMGPAERELWQTCSDLNDTTPQAQADIKPMKIKRNTFTPIIEESDKSISIGMKDTRPDTFSILDKDPITVAFAELNEVYREYYPQIDSSSITTVEDNQNKGQEVMASINVIHVNSASDDISDVKRHAGESEGKISEVQSNATESVSVSQNLHANDNQVKEDNLYKTETEFGDNSRINIVLEKKKYWDDKIRQIEEIRSQEIKSQQKKKRLCTKHMKQDSLSKKKGKQVIKNFLKVNGSNLKSTDSHNEMPAKSKLTPHISVHVVQEKAKPVEKWKKYWDEKLEVQKDNTNAIYSRAMSPNSIKSLSPVKPELFAHKQSNGKHELPEEVFKAFETSPKRFFGTSRKQILNKLDAFLGKENTVKESYVVTREAVHDSGLVSSRISLFHNITKTEPLPIPQRKSRSLHDIYQEKEEIKNTISLDENILNNSKDTSQFKVSSSCHNVMTDEIQPKHTAEEGPDEVKKRVRNSISLQDNKTTPSQIFVDESFEDTTKHKTDTENDEHIRKQKYIKNLVKEINKQSDHSQIYKKSNILSKRSISKSEMDIFNKTTNKSDNDDLDKRKSYEELPKINVKSFISLYENVSKSVTSQPSSISSQKDNNSFSLKSGTKSELKPNIITMTSHVEANREIITNSPTPPPRRKKLANKTSRCASADRSFDSEVSLDSIDIEVISLQDSKETTYLSYSDIELEIVENKSQKPVTPSTEIDAEVSHTDYKSRFKMAKQYFLSLEELRAESTQKLRKPNECELLLYKDSKDTNRLNELFDSSKRAKKRVKRNIKSHSMPSSEISKFWNQMLHEKESIDCGSKLVKISEKFNVEDLFSDVTEGKLSRQGSLRGVPHKKAVLETFRSMENVSIDSLSSYEFAISQLNDFAKENKIKNVQTYLTEYPYLPTTSPSKYYSRLDPKASGLITMKELLNSKPRRNSVPDLRLNAKFTADL